MSKQRNKPPQQRRQGQSQPQVQKAPDPTKANAEMQAEQAAKQEAKREARMQRQEAERSALLQRQRMKKLRNIAIAAVLVILVAGGVTAYFVNESSKPGQGVSQQPSPHIDSLTSPHSPYSTDPPTSGPHTKEVPSWGVHAEAVAKELQIHALEDAGVVISYRPDLDAATLDRLKALTESYDTDVLLAPYPGLSNPIVLTAWTRIDRLDAFDEARIKLFIKAYMGIDHHKDSGT